METPLSPLDFAQRARRLYSRRVGVVEGDQRLTYGEFFDRCDRWSAALLRLAVRPGDRVASIAPNLAAHLRQFYAVPQIGAICVPINFRLAPADFAYILRHSGAQVVCVAPEHVATIDALREELPGVRHFVTFGTASSGWLAYDDLIAESTPDFTPHAYAESDVISINYTSGTTARPKGVMVTHRNTALNGLGHLVHIHLTTADRFLWVVPMFHANGWTFVWNVTAVGATHICLPRADARHILETIIEEGVTIFAAAPTVLIALANLPEELRRRAPRGVRVITAGAPPAAATIERLEGELGWTILHVYGLTEVSPVVTICEILPEQAGLSLEDRAVFKARQGVEYLANAQVRVVDDQGREVPHDGTTLGEIVIRGNAVMTGYYNDPEATAGAIRDGWFHSGDAAVVHPDGYIQIRDRWKDVIISGGENISSIEVEALLLQHPAVQEAAVVGVPDPYWGESPVACVVFRPGSQATAAELRDFCREHLAHFKVPKQFHPVAELPKTATGKIQKFVLRGQLTSPT
jgi:fatty-acyl-CoA synthase